MTERKEPYITPEPLPFSESAQRVIQSAKEIALRRRHCVIGIEHLLLSLIEEKAVGETINILNIDPRKIRRLAEMALEIYYGEQKSGQELPEEPQLNTYAKLVTEYADVVATIERSKEITPLHLLMGVYHAERLKMSAASSGSDEYRYISSNDNIQGANAVLHYLVHNRTGINPLHVGTVLENAINTTKRQSQSSF